MHTTLHPIDGVERLYVSRKEGGRGLTSIEDRVDASVRLKGYKEKYEGLITAIRNDTANMMDSRMIITRKNNGKKKKPIRVLNDY